MTQNKVLKIFIACAFLLQISNGQSIKGGSRSSGSRGVKGGSHSQTYSGSSSRIQEEPVQQQHYGQSNAAPQASCDRPNAPMNGGLSCMMSNNRYTCKGTCNSGFKFPDGTDTLELECSQMTGVWLPYRNFPECVGSYSRGGGGYESSQDRTYRREYSQSSSHQAQSSYGTGYGQEQSSQSSYGGRGGGGYGQRQSQLTQNLCGSPKSPMNGRHYCSMSNGQWTCQGNCNPGYDFPDGSRQMTLTCHDLDGIWSPAPGFPDCAMLCHPQCENGGQCTVHNQCVCPSTHRGNRCQYSILLCDFNRIAPALLISDCTHSADVTDCKISCPPGMRFEPVTTSHYRCTVDGQWTPPTPPTCVTESLCERPPPPMNGNIQCQGSSEIMLCRGACESGFMFPDGFSELTIQCFRTTGEWSPDVGFPNCEPICNPTCENGGRCIGHNSCLCTRGYRGSRCEYAVSNCDGHDRFASVAWSCKNDQQETVCIVGCAQTGGTLQPAEPTTYVCSLDGTWQPDFKPICVTDYSSTDRRTAQSERYVNQKESQYRQSSGHSQLSRDRDTRRRSSEFGGQQQVNHEFEGQQPVDLNFGGQQQSRHEFAGQQQVDHDFGGQQQLDYDFNNRNRRLNLGGYPDEKDTSDEYYAQKPLAREYEEEERIYQHKNIPDSSLTRQEEGKEAFGVGVAKGGYGAKGKEERYRLEDEDAQDLRNHIEEETEIPLLDIFSNVEKVSSFHGICSAWGYHHLRSFDGGVFTFPSSCPYILASSCEQGSPIISVVTMCDPLKPCTRIVAVQNKENTYMLSYDSGLTQDGETIPIPTHIGDLTVERVARYLVARLTTGFNIWINDENTVLIVANQFMKNRTCGMCGNYDGYLEPQFINKDGTRTSDIYGFANSWKTDPSGVCIDNVETQSPCSTETREKRLASDKSNLLCATIYDAQFHACAVFVDPEIYYAKCQMDCCSLMAADDCECASIAEFVLECSRNGADTKQNWRTPGLCPLICTNGTEYNECGPPCPATCDDQEPTCQQEKCVDGCHCPRGTVLENGRCIPVTQCPCHHSDRIYASGETMEQDCNTCVCESGNWQCTDVVCPARCLVSGPHIETFDDLVYELSGQCSHYLVEADDFNVQIDYGYNCRELPSLTSVCIRGITILTTEGAIVKLKQTMEVSVNGREIISLPVQAPGVYVGQATSKYIKAQLNNGLEILWDMDTSIQLLAPVSLFDEVRGLCGTFTRSQSDDFLTPEGDIEKSSKVFAEKWRVEESCMDLPRQPESEQEKPCDRDPRRRTFATRVCSIIKEGEFQECHSLIDYQRYYDECMEDVCGCMTEPTSCSCLSLSNYARACANRGKPLSWRQNVPECGIPCPMGQIYLACANPCSYTCAEIANSYANCREECVEGCVCPPGQTLDVHGKCMPVSSCSCIHSGHMYPPEFMQRRGKEMCECSQGQWACYEASPEDILLTPPPHVAPDCDATKNLESTDCISECPITCANLHHHQPCTTSICTPGCRCKKGYVMDASSGKCVLPVECPCHHSGRSYQEGEEVKMDCHTCICDSGMWECDSHPCPGLCSAWGDSHYETFDGRLFDFEGSCDYVLVKAHVSQAVVYSVVIQNIPCGGSGGVTCGKSLSITLGEQSMMLTRDHPIPELPEDSRLSVTSVGMFILVDSDIGISVQWDRNTRVYVTAQPIWQTKLFGLCGNFDDDSSNDFTSPSGGIPLVLAKDFADSWRVHKYCKPATQQEDTCDRNPERRTWSKQKCSVLKSDLFKPCHYQVEVEEYFKRCVFDACACDSGGDCECMCAVVSAYAQKCARRGVVIAWRTQDLCPIQCETCDEYNPCISLCPPPNCDTYLEDSKETHSCSREPCVEGCDPKPCEQGHVYKSATNLTCIPEHFCTEKPCIVIDGIPYRDGERIENKDIGDPCQSCYCRHGEVECIGVPCTTSTVKPIIGVKLEECQFTGWTDWINSVDPLDNGGNDFEDIEDLVASQRLPCPKANITSIQCRTVETQEPSETVKQNVICDLEDGLQCKSDYYNGVCDDYEIRVYCQCHEEVTCPPGQEWNTCAFNCEKVCHSLETYLDEEEACERDQECVPGCVKEICKPPKLARDADTCVTPDMCTCRLTSGVVIAPGEVVTDGCQKCQCLNNTPICSTTLDCKEIITEIPPIMTKATYVYEEYSTPEPLCYTGWNDWQSLHLPDRQGETESLEDHEREDLLGCTMDQITQIQCREVKTLKVVKHSGEDDIYCDLRNKGLVCKNKDMRAGKKCLDFEIRAYCDCSRVKGMRGGIDLVLPMEGTTPEEFVTIITTVPSRVVTEQPAVGIIITTPSCSYWSDWINKGKPRKGKKHGDREDTRPYILKQTEGFCLEGYVSAIECREVETGKDFSETNEEKLICDINKGFQCQNKYQPDGRCQDYKIRYFCTCGEEETGVPIVLRTTPPTYVYPCSELIPLIDGDEPLPDSRIKASSSDSFRSGPDAIKIRKAGRNRAWTADISDKKPYIEVDLGDIRAVYGIITKGKEDSDEWITSYQLLYSPDGTSYSYYQDENDINKVFSGNYDDTMEVKHIFSLPFEARYVRLEPLSWEERISLQMDLLGCAEAVTTEATEEPSEPFGTEITPEEECKAPMGMADENILGYHLSASSFEDEGTSPENGRMGSDTAWVAGEDDSDQYYQVNFYDDATLTGVVTKGHADLPQWVRSYTIAYSTDMQDWEDLKDEDGEIIKFSANDDQDTPVTNEFPEPINVKSIRIIPVSWKNRIAMQVEILGCPLPPEDDEDRSIPPKEVKKCKKKMGLENGLLMDNQLSASSSFSSKFTPDFSRMGSSSVWAAAEINDDQYLQVDFIDLQRVSGVITKGREDVPQWVTAYVVEFSKDGTTWNKIKDEDENEKEFPANYDPFSTVQNLFPHPVRARLLRIRPTKWKNWISMQIELLGCYHPSPCRDPMGVENGVITGHQLTASTEISETLSADDGRLSSPRAWSPDIKDKYPYLQVDLLEPTELSGVITKGNAEAQQWVKSFYIAYSNDTTNWRKVENVKGKAKEFEGNSDQDSAVINLFPISATGRYFRVIPLEWHKWIALRMELLGCFHERVCLEPMGLEDGILADSLLSSSTSLDLDTTPSHARINDKSGWQPDKLDKHPYLQVDLKEPRNVSATVTKGMKDADNWITRFKVTFSDDGDKWFPIIKDDGDDVVFDGNEDRDTPVVNLFPEAIEARYFRIIPLKFKNAIGLRLELLGCYHPYDCQESLGMESGDVLDFQISASSFLSNELSPANSRLDSDTAWAAKENDDDQFIQVDLIIPTNITGIMTRGRNDANEWVEEYKVSYSLEKEDVLFSEISEDGEVKTFPANHDSETSVTNIFSKPVFARFIRIIPTKYEKRISMRFELIGCLNKTECMEPMGLESGLLTDSHITASSSQSEDTNPAKLRINSDSSWTPENLHEPQFVQVNFGDPRNISAIVTKGDANEPIWVKTYQVAHSNDEETWTLVEDSEGNIIEFPGNTDNDSPVISVLPETIEAQYIRIIPTDWKKWIALRAEILGCYHPYEEYVTEFVTVLPDEVFPLIGVPTEPPMLILCPDKMEAESSVLINARIKASSSTPSGNPTRILLNTKGTEDQSGGWVPNVDDLHPVLLIELPEPKLLTSIHIQGRADEENWVRTLRVVASVDNSTWMPVFGPDSNEYIKANDDQTTVVTVHFDRPEEAKYVKIIPETWHKWPSFRMDLKGCHKPEVTSVIPTTPGYPEICPELENHPELTMDCPKDCPDGKLCDGKECVDPIDCSCLHNGDILKVGDRIQDRSCKQCDCALGGHTVCQEKQCEPCEEGKATIVIEDCSCTCEECGEDEKLCPSNMECIPKRRWCDGIVDCPDDETDCLHTTTVISTTEPGVTEEPVGKPRIAPGIVLPTKPSGPTNATCNIMGKHINTFDGQDIVYDICNHVAMKDIKAGKFNVTIHKQCGFFSECKHWIEVYHFNQHIKVQSDLEVEVNGHSYNTAQLWRLSKNTKMTLLAKKVGEQVIIKSLLEGFTLIYDVRGHLEIEVTPELNRKIAGLCGYFSGRKSDDQRKPNGKKAFTSKEFGESWATGDREEECKPLVCPHEEMQKAMDLCRKIKDAPFIQCGKLLPVAQFLEFCMSSTCECLLNKKNSENKCKCDGFLPFVEACESKLGPLAVRNWRLIHECHTECPPGMEWNDCGPSCQLTCDSASPDAFEECSGRCVPGCFCPPGTVLNDDQCIPPDQCTDQVCQGFGDPHFRTFDGLFFPFQAVGSFLIVGDKDKNFLVNGLTKKCGLFTPITCLVGMEITYKDHLISIKKQKELKVDGKKIRMDKLPLHKDGMVILGYPGRTFVVVIPAIHFEARYYEENSGFAVKVPSRKYFNQTEGLCGNCNGRKNDELETSLDEYVCSWQTDGSKEECMESLQELPNLAEEIPVCKKLQKPIFEACHPIVNVDIYVDACNFDATHSGDAQASFCKTAMEYGRQCCQAGISIADWSKEFGCDIDCPSGMEFEQCHKGCPQTCVSLRNHSDDSSCNQMKTDGCFCPTGKILKGEICVDTQLCDTCDEEGHVPGDSWSDGDCKKCHCREDLTTECVLELCPMKPICSAGETLVKSERETLSCCDSYVCVPKEEKCETMEVPKCKTGEVAKVHTGDDSCPVLKCECDPILCAPLVWPEELEEGQNAIISNESCCPVIQIACFEESCPKKPDCNVNLELVEAKGECCNTYKCKPPKDVCVYSHLYKIIDGFQSLVEQIEVESTIYQPGDEWEDGLCEKCSCVESQGQFVPQCIKEQCPSMENMPDNKDYVLREQNVPDKCCPDIFKVQCRDDDGNIYEPGDQWQDEENPCVTYLCEEYGGGEVVKTKSIINCTECPRTAVLFPPSKALGQCCGVCKPSMCEEGDDLYTVGDTWINTDDVCKMAECVSEFGRVYTVFTKQPCPTIPEDCPPNEIIWDENGCCKVCNLTSEISCSTGPIPEEDTIGFFTSHEPSEGGVCVNEKPVSSLVQCKGACHSQSFYSLEDGDFKDNCKCCKVNVTANRTVELRCPNGNYITRTFLQPETCQCSKCAPKSGGAKSKTNFNSQQTWVQQNQLDSNSEFVIAQTPSEKGRFTEQRNVEQEPINSWQFGQNQVQQEQEDYDNF